MPREDGTATDSGQIQIFPVTDLDAEVTYSQGSPGVAGGVAAGDRFGFAVAFVAGVSERAVLVGVPDDVDNNTEMVNVLPLGRRGAALLEAGDERRTERRQPVRRRPRQRARRHHLRRWSPGVRQAQRASER